MDKGDLRSLGDRLKQQLDNIIKNTAPIPPIRLGSRDAGVQLASAGLVLVLVMRGLALSWLGGGAIHWLDLLSRTSEAFASMSAQRLAATYFFCAMDFVAAIGLWLAAPWGGVVWLVTVGVQVLSFILLPAFWTHGVLLMWADAVLVPLYLASAWYAGREEGE